MSDTAGADVAIALRGFRDGDKVKAVVLDIDQRRISLSMKPSHFNEEDFEDQGVSDDGSEALGVVDDGDLDDDAVSATGSAIEEMSDDEDNEDEDEEMQVDFEPESQLYTPNGAVEDSSTVPHTSSLQISGGFKWSGDDVQQSKVDDDSDASSNEEDDEEQPGRKKRRKRKEIEQDLTADMHTKTPESNADFERLLLGSPNSSYLWIQYMSFQLQLSEVDKAREIARRALQTIHFREEQEKLNVWIALLNLECAYGTDETLESTFKEAARANDSKTVHLRLALIFDQAGKHQVCHCRSSDPQMLSPPFLLSRMQRNSINERARSSGRVPKYGHFSASIIFNKGILKSRGSCFPDPSRVSIRGNVRPLNVYSVCTSG